jgi:divalent metal cation (Fe/Co/Zn/Cd) transporter
MKVAKEKKSTVLESNAIHHRVDSLTGIVALVTIAVSNLIPGLSSLDAVGGLLISWMVIRAGLTNVLASAGELLDRSIDNETKTKVQSITEAAIVKHLSEANLREVVGTAAGQSSQIDVEIGVPNSESIERLHGLETVLRKEIASQFKGARRIRIRFVPSTIEKELADEFISPTPNGILKDEHSHHDHDHDHKTPNENNKP